MQDTAIALAIGTLTFVVTVIWGDPFIDFLKLFGIGLPLGYDDDLTAGDTEASPGANPQIEKRSPKLERVRSESDSRSQVIPTMGGLMFMLPATVVTLGLNIASLLNQGDAGLSVLLPLGVMLSFGAVGLLDDWETLRGIREDGISARLRIISQVVIASAAALFLQFVLDIHSVALPGIEARFDLEFLYLPIAILVIFTSANSFDLTDGPDGLAGIVGATAFAAYGIVALQQGQVFLVQFCFVMVGAVVAFLWFNTHPARLNLGDTGALALGATIGTVALMTGQWLILPVIIAIPFAESATVALQIFYYNYARRVFGEPRQLFRRAPLHNHFRLLGWSDPQIVQRFWIIEVLAALVGVALALL